MRILFDQGTPVPLRRSLAVHEVGTAWQHGWAQLSNGDLLTAAETAGYVCSSPPIKTCATSRTSPPGVSPSLC